MIFSASPRTHTHTSARRQLLFTFGLLLLLPTLCLGQTYTISTFAGPQGVADGGPAIEAFLHSPSGIAVDSAGNLYIADSGHHRIRKVSPAGTITTFAGTGTAGFGGDGGPATEALLDTPAGLAVDGAGNLYFADFFNHRVRKVTPSGTISTVVGTGIPGFGGDGGPATNAQIGGPAAVALDSLGNLYIGEIFNNRVRRVNSAGTIQTFAGTGVRGFSGDGGPAAAAQLDEPTALATDSSGDLYIVDRFNHRIRKVSAGTITTIAGDGTFGFSGDGGLATSAQIADALSVAVDASGNVFIGEQDSFRVRKITAGIITTFAGNGTDFPAAGDGGPAELAQIGVPAALAVDSGEALYIADSLNNLVRKVVLGIIDTVAGTPIGAFSGDGGPAVAARFNAPRGVDADDADNVFIADVNNRRIRQVNRFGVITTIAGNGSQFPADVDGPATTVALGSPHDVAVDSAGNVYATVFGLIKKIDTSGFMTVIAGNGLPGTGGDGDGGPATAAQVNPSGIAVDFLGNIYFSDESNDRVRRIDPSGIITTFAGNGTSGFSGDGGPAVAAQLDRPVGIAADGAGNVFIADRGNRRIRVVEPNGTISTVAGGGSIFPGNGGPATEARLSSPVDVDIDGEGNIYIATGALIRKVDTSGSLNTIAGNGRRGFSGDGGPATDAELSNPLRIAAGPAGEIYVGDSGNHRIRLLTPVPVPEPPPPVSLRVQPTHISLELPQDAAAASNTVTLTALNGDLTFSVLPGGSWISAEPNRGSLSDGIPATIQAVIEPAGLSVGTHQSRLFIRAGADISSEVSITLEVTGPATPPPPPEPPKPIVSENGVVNAASMAPFGEPGHAVAPGSMISIFGENFTDGEHFEATTLPLPTSLGGVSVTFDGIPARLFGVWPNQINAQFPAGISAAALTASGASQAPTPAATVVVEPAAGASDPRAVEIAAAGPGIFTATAQGNGQGIVVFSNTMTLAAPAGFNNDSRPATAGDRLTIYATGLGAVDPPIENGANSCDPGSQCLPDFSNVVLRRTIETPRITIGGVQVPQDKVLFSGLAPEFVAVNIVIIELPPGIAPGDAVPINIAIGGSASPPAVTLAVE